MRKSKHIRVVLNNITCLHNDIFTLTREISKLQPNSPTERLQLRKIRIKVRLIEKYNRRLKILSI